MATLVIERTAGVDAVAQGFQVINAVHRDGVADDLGVIEGISVAVGVGNGVGHHHRVGEMAALDSGLEGPGLAHQADIIAGTFIAEAEEGHNLVEVVDDMDAVAEALGVSPDGIFYHLGVGGHRGRLVAAGDLDKVLNGVAVGIRHLIVAANGPAAMVVARARVRVGDGHRAAVIEHILVMGKV